jgi:p-hydroxybenzoate 3-monooxygenase
VSTIEAMRTQVAIVGAGPAGLLLARMLHLVGIESIILERRSRRAIEATIRAGVLEQTTVDLMRDIGADTRLRQEGRVHRGFELRFGGSSHRIDLAGLTEGRAITVYPQHEVLRDLVALRSTTGEPTLFECPATGLTGLTSDRPGVHFTDASGRQGTIACDFVVACDGSFGIGRTTIPDGTLRGEFARTYPFAWFGILARCPPSSDELIYAHHERGFALVSTRSPSVQRLYFQCDPGDSVEAWSDERIWDELRTRVAVEGFRLSEGEIFQKDIIPLRSFVSEPMQHGRLFVAGDAAHIVPPTGAKGLNLAAADVAILSRALRAYYASGATDLLERYSQTALRRVWHVQHFSWWMTSMLHRMPDANAFDRRRQLAELEHVVGSRAAATNLAQSYVGLPLD